jgi:hypothetical protein
MAVFNRGLRVPTLSQVTPGEPAGGDTTQVRKTSFVWWLRKAALVLLLSGAGFLAFVSGTFFLRVEMLTYGRMGEISWEPEALATKVPWLDPECVWLIEGEGYRQDAPPKTDRILVFFSDSEWPGTPPGGCVTSRSRREEHLPPRYPVTPGDHQAISSWTRESELFCLPFRFREIAINDMVNYRVVEIYRDPDYLRPLLLAAVQAVALSCCAFLLMAGMLRLGTLCFGCSRSERLHLSLPITLAGCVLATIPKLALVLFVIGWDSAPLYGLERCNWSSTTAINDMIFELAGVSWSAWLLMLLTVLVLWNMSSALAYVAIRRSRVQPLAKRFGRVTLWLIPCALLVWWALSTLSFEPVGMSWYHVVFNRWF